MRNLLIWGTGNLAEKFIKNKYNGEIIGFVETNKINDTYMDKFVYDSQKLPKEYDYIIVANSYTMEIYNHCLELGIDVSKVIFLHPARCEMGCVDKQVLKEILSEENYAWYCMEFGLTEDTFVQQDAVEYGRSNRRRSFAIQEQYMWPVLCDKYTMAGAMGNYFWQDLWAAKKVIKSKVREHWDIGSRVDGFIAHLLAADIRVNVIDIRPFPAYVDNLFTIVDDATELNQFEDNSISSMSALCSLEHFGLGRYGDSIDPEACFKCFENIQKKLKKGGRLYLSVPVGSERVEFNAHRVFYASTVVEAFAELHLEEFSCAAQEMIEYNADIHKYDDDLHNGEYRYGLFSFIKL